MAQFIPTIPSITLDSFGCLDRVSLCSPGCLGASYVD